MHTKWLEEHVSEVADALMSRMNREAMGGVYRRFQLVYFPSTSGARGGLAAIPMDDKIPEGWQPLQDCLSDATSLTRDQVRYRIHEAARTAPVLDPNE